MKKNIYPVQIIRRRQSKSPSTPVSGSVKYDTLKEFLSTNREEIIDWTRGYTALNGYYPSLVYSGISMTLVYNTFDICFANSNVQKLVRVRFDRTSLRLLSKYYYDDNNAVFSIMDSSSLPAAYSKYVGDIIVGNIPIVQSKEWEYTIENNIAYMRNFNYTGDTIQPDPKTVPQYALRFAPQYYRNGFYSSPPGEKMLELMCSATVDGNEIFTYSKTRGYPTGGTSPVDYTITENEAFDAKLRNDFSGLQYDLPDSLIIEFIQF